MRKEYRENVRENITQTALNILQASGIEKVTIRSIAQKLKISVGSIYTYFADKESILREIYGESCRELLQLLQESVCKDLSDEENYINLTVLICNFRIQNASRYQEIYFRLKEYDLETLKPIRSFMHSQLKSLKLPALSTSDALEKADRTVLALCEGIARIVLGKKEFAWKELILFSVKSLIKSWKINKSLTKEIS